MRNIIAYGLVGALAFGIGSCHQRKTVEEEMSSKKYETVQTGNKWYLATPEGNKEIHANHQVGTVEYRMKGLLSEEYNNLKDSLEKIIKKD